MRGLKNAGLGREASFDTDRDVDGMIVLMGDEDMADKNSELADGLAADWAAPRAAYRKVDLADVDQEK